MEFRRALIFSALCCVVQGAGAGAGAWAGARAFPPRFQFGAATSAYQVEGALNISESIWHRFSHTAGAVSDGGTGDVACDSVRLWTEDVTVARDLALDHYRFSISWVRLLPTALPDQVSEAGRKYYSDLIDALLEAGIEPVVTIYHWDLPQRLQDLGGWANPLIVDWFSDYARVVFSLFGDRVPTWLTINEPTVFCDLSYNAGIMAPGVIDPQYASFLCIKHALLAHAKAWRIYDEEFRHKYHGSVSFTDVAMWVEPLTTDDQELADLANEYGTGLYTHAVYSDGGGWPPRVEALIEAYSTRRGLPRSVLPPFTRQEAELVRGTFDFLALNYYVSRAASPAGGGAPGGGGEVPVGCLATTMPAIGADISARPDWPTASSHAWFTIYPAGLRAQLNWFQREYGNIPLRIMELGYPDTDPGLDDPDRIKYLRDHMEQILLAIEDGVNVTGVTVWSLMDNFEWMDGYSTHFGLYYVNFTSPRRPRTPRTSAHYYAEVIRTRTLIGGVDRPKDEL